MINKDISSYSSIFSKDYTELRFQENRSINITLLNGDIVKKLDGEIVRHTTFASMIARKAPGTIIELEVLRAGEIVNIEITLLERQIDN